MGARWKILAAAAAVAVAVAGCADPVDRRPGTVVETAKRSVTVRLDGTGERVTYRTSKAVARRCRKAVPPRWPDCV